MNKTYRKRIWSIILSVALIIQVCVPVFAYDEQEHSAILESVLLGKKHNLNSYSKSTKKAIEALEEASSLMIDQFNHSKSEELISLRKKVNGLPAAIEEIDYSSNAIIHRKYTHRGWEDSSYENFEKKECHWQVRKSILQKTVFQLWTDDVREGEAFSKLVYYVHILGDYQYDREQAIAKIGITPNAKTTDIERIGEIEFPNTANSLAEYITKNGWLPDNYITKEEARDIRSIPSNKGLSYADIFGDTLIGGNVFGNYEGHLPELKDGERYYECDISYGPDGNRNDKRIVFTKSGVVYYSNDHYNSFHLIFPELYKNKNTMLGLGGRADKKDIVNELLIVCDELFSDQSGSSEFIELSRGLRALNKDMSEIEGATGGINTNGRYLKYLGYAEKVISVLQRHIPKLIGKKEFYEKVVYQ